MSTELSSFEVMRLVRELNDLEGGFLQKVYQPLEDILVLKVNTKGGTRYILHKVGDWLYITEKVDLELTPVGKGPGEGLSGFVRALRKHLSNAYLSGARQVGFDRVIEIGLKKQLPYVLVMEVFGKGNVILTRRGTIVSALRTRVWRHRTIRGGSEYKPPPQRQDPRSLDMAELAVLLNKSHSDLVRTLATNVNLGGTYAEEVCHRARLDKSTPVDELQQKDYRAILDAISGIETEVKTGDGGFIHNVGGSRREVTAVRLRKYGEEAVESFSSLSRALMEMNPIQDMIEDRLSVTDLGPMMERLENQRSKQQEALDGFHEEIEASTAKAEAIYVHYEDLESLLAELGSARESGDWGPVVENHPDIEIDGSRGHVSVKVDPVGTSLEDDVEELELVLDLRKDLNENASRYYERAKHLKDKIEGAERALKMTGREIERMREMQAREGERIEEEVRSRRLSHRRRFWFESKRWFVTRDGNVVVGGRDARSNRKVVRKYMKDGDRYVHADIHGAPSIVVKSSGVNGQPLEITGRTLEEACHYAVCFSKAWSQRIGSGEAYWVTPAQVSTTPESGEFLPKGGFIIRGKRNYIRNLELEVAIGPVELDGVELLMCGPVETLEEMSDEHYRLVPAAKKKSGAVKALSREFGVGVEEVDSILPPGGVNIIGLEH